MSIGVFSGWNVVPSQVPEVWGVDPSCLRAAAEVRPARRSCSDGWTSTIRSPQRKSWLREQFVAVDAVSDCVGRVDECGPQPLPRLAAASGEGQGGDHGTGLVGDRRGH